VYAQVGGQAFGYFAEGYGDVDPGMPTARAAFDEAITRC
jgi:hypothetical protein